MNVTAPRELRFAHFDAPRASVAPTPRRQRRMAAPARVPVRQPVKMDRRARQAAIASVLHAATAPR